MKFQVSRCELKEKHLNRLQEKYNNLIKENLTLIKKYDKLVYASIETVFNEYNEDIELLARCLYSQGKIERNENEYINPLNESCNATYFKIRGIKND